MILDNFDNLLTQNILSGNIKKTKQNTYFKHWCKATHLIMLLAWNLAVIMEQCLYRLTVFSKILGRYGIL